MMGTDVCAALQVMQGMGIDAFGLNCSAGPEEMLPQIRRLAEYAAVPLITKPNAGLPQTVDGKTVYSVNAEEFVSFVPALAEAGVNIRMIDQGSSELNIIVGIGESDFEDAIRLAVSYGGDSDTLASIVGALAGAYYEIPTKLNRKAMSFLPEEMQNVIREFHKKYINLSNSKKRKDEMIHT